MKTTYYFDVISTEIGPLTVAVDETGAVTELYTSDRTSKFEANSSYVRNCGAVAEVGRQLTEYATGNRKQFDVRLNAKGTEFQHRVWTELVQIPFGETRTYGELAARLGNPNASRAVGRANATNPISIIVPCHRVIGHSGALTGYAGGLPTKQKLLELEGICLPTLFDVT